MEEFSIRERIPLYSPQGHTIHLVPPWSVSSLSSCHNFTSESCSVLIAALVSKTIYRKTKPPVSFAQWQVRGGEASRAALTALFASERGCGKSCPKSGFPVSAKPWLPVHGTGVPIGDSLQAIGRSVRVRVALFIVRALEKLQFHAGSCEIYASRAAADARGVSLLPKREQEVVERVVEGLFTSTSSMVEGKGSIALCRRPPRKDCRF
jgi:hypothetical protein